MCGRYYMDESMARDLRRLAGEDSRGSFPSGDVVPSHFAPVLTDEGQGLRLLSMKWGFPGFEGRGLLINGRAESVKKKPVFRDSFLTRRCVIPAGGFYEWNREREKFRFERASRQTIYMAGCYNLYQNERCFVILTTEANETVRPVHERMPLILEEEELEQWLLSGKEAEALLKKTPARLEAKTDYEQLRLPYQ